MYWYNTVQKKWFLQIMRDVTITKTVKSHLTTAMKPFSFLNSVKYVLVLCIVSSHLVLGQEIIDFGAKDRVEADRLQKVIEELCKNRPVNEYFRLSAESNCRDAVRCVNNDFGGGPKLAAIRCPAGLVFDLDGQTCNWASQVRFTRCFNDSW